MSVLKVNTTEVVDDSGNISWNRIKNKPAIPANCSNCNYSNCSNCVRSNCSNCNYTNCSNCAFSNCSNCNNCSNPNCNCYSSNCDCAKGI